MMKNMKLRKRILLGYLPPLLLMVAVCATVVWDAQSLSEISKSVQLHNAVVANIKDAQFYSAAMVKSARGYMLARDETSRKNYGDARALMRTRLQTLGKQITESRQIETLSKLVEVNARLTAVTDKDLQLVDAGERSKTLQSFGSQTSIELSREFDKLIEDFEKRETELLAVNEQAENNALDSLVTLVLSLTAAAVAVALALGWWISARVSETLVEAVADMSTSSSEIASTVDEHERVVTQQAAAVSETTTTVEELGASSRQSAAQAESAADAAKEALAVTQDGIRLAGQVSASMAGMKQKVGSVAEQILRLSEQAGQIGSIAKVVGELAGETNMLALNAAVEAARAGEHGKGFAVVAAEVRKLADQSKKSAERANVLVAEIQKATNSAVMVTEEGSRTTEDVAAIIAKTLEVFSTISSNANSVSVSAQQVLLNSRQQANALGQVTDAMKSLAAGSAQMAAGTEQTKKGVQKLNDVARGLKAMV
jgi:methyl-accepting chemotaxis protein